MNRNLLIKYSILLSFLAITLFLTFNWHRNPKYFSYHSELWSDKAGYYVYLPALKFNFDPALFPDSIEEKTGHGFKVDYLHKKIITKYTCGVAILEFPFFLSADLIAHYLNGIQDGFSPIYQKTINVAAVFYLVMGFFFLQKFLRARYKSVLIIAVFLTLFLGTNLYYYSIADTGMSHIYSFFLFSFFLYYLQKQQFLAIQTSKAVVLLGVIAGLIILVRPTNVLFLSSFFFINLNSKAEILQRFQRIFNLKIAVLLFCGASISFAPQFIYWHYAYDHSLAYSYGDEGFNWLRPQVLKSWFSPNNGLFVYSPLYAVIIIGLIFQSIKKSLDAKFILTLFILMSYVFSSWWSWGFGCAYGGRSYVEYLTLFSIPLASLISEFSTAKKFTRAAFYICIVLVSAYNIKMTYSYGGCFYGNNDWDWNTFVEMIKAPTK